MAAYRIFQVVEGHIQAPPVIAECPDDASAIEQALALAESGQVEVWLGKRLVATLPPQNSNQTTPQKGTAQSPTRTN
jgi:hypothetical protein